MTSFDPNSVEFQALSVAEQLRIRPLIGLETEYGVHAPANPTANHSVLSMDLVNAYAARMLAEGSAVAGTEWDYGEESPLVDARGWTMPRSAAHPSQLTDEPLGPEQVAAEAIAAERAAGRWEDVPTHQLMNLVLTNGARFYVDHAHPEYSSPETSTYRAAVLYDQAGEIVLRRATEYLAREQGAQIRLYKNNTDNKGVSYGAHENYLVSREVDFDALAAALLPFFTSRQVICGAGRAGVGIGTVEPRFQISQRADFFEEQVGLETTIRRPIVNTRDEPHAWGEKYRRLHVIIGDANLSQYSTWLRVGITDLVLGMISSGWQPSFALLNPVSALQIISHDPTLEATVHCTDRVARTGLQILEYYLQQAQAFWQEQTLPDHRRAEVDEMLQAWQEILTDLSTDIFSTADRLDWVAKYQLIRQVAQRHNVGLDDPKIAMLDLQYTDIDPTRGLYYKLVAAGRMRTLVDAAEIEAAADQPPQDTRAYLRGQAIKHFSHLVAGVSWETLLLRSNTDQRIHRILLSEPFAGSATEAAELFSGNVEDDEFIRRALNFGAGRRKGADR
ncbi:depupylase/deamidase Dop [Micrococcoides hystricis]|uniref:Depupylase/deamidase Dop n=1 Tax=Micrococcoides hystricis TaxID=1572761 RepID=A0ABV6P7E8_9MICC